MSSQARRGSGITDEERKYLENQLRTRHTRQELERQGVLKKGGVHAAKHVVLEQHLTQDRLARALDHRPSATDLRHGHVLEGDVSDRLAATAKQLKRNMIKDRLGHAIPRQEPRGNLTQPQVLPAGDVAPRLQGAKLKLERAMRRDSISHALEGRPSYAELEKRGIVGKADTAPRVQAAQRQLQKSLTEDTISHLLESRSDLETLQHQGIIEDVRVAPSIQQTQKHLKNELTRSQVYHNLRMRPSLEEVKRQGIYRERPEAEREAQAESKERLHMPLSTYARRSKNFHLTRLLLKFISSMSDSGELTLSQKGKLKDLVVDQNPTILAVASAFDCDKDLSDFKDSLVRLASR